MQIERANIYHVPTGSRRAVILELVTDGGVSGAGEAGIAYGAGGRAVAEMLREMVERFVLGQDSNAIGSIWQRIYDRSFWTRNGGAISYAALAAIELALWDIKGKRLDAPVHELLGGRMRDGLPVYANGWWTGCDSPDEYAAAAANAAGRGFAALKFYPLAMTDLQTVVRHPARRTLDTAALNLACERVAAVREAVGPGVEILLDFGGGLTTDQVLRICRRIEQFDILLIEEAVDPGWPEAFAEVAAGTSIALAAGERAYGRQGFQRLLQTGAVHVLQPDVCNTGGLLEARMIAGMAEIHNARIAPHNYGSTLATAVAAQYAAVIPNFMLLEYFPDYEREPAYLAVLEDPPEARVRDSVMPVPDGPGLGVRLARDNLEPWLLARCEA
jgi:galactonate dehydratase